MGLWPFVLQLAWCLGTEVLRTASTDWNAPLLPSQFDCKVKLDIAYESETESRPILLLLHVDLESGRSREDYYYIHQDPPQKFYTAIRRFDEDRQFMVFYRVENDTLRSPQSCFIAPNQLYLPGRDFLRQSATYVNTTRYSVRLNGSISTFHAVSTGSKNTATGTGSSAEDTIVSTVYANEWEFEYQGVVFQLLESTRTRMPLFLSRVRFAYSQRCDEKMN